MTVILFRPFKRMNDRELIEKIYSTFDHLKKGPDNREISHLCDQLIREAKIRKLECPKEILYERIFYR
ncbi:hypothetical protein [Geosporobacter ferrireducens]|uniref:Uncharacterized protein n=1 Tax=Geosporobacter ferrireducens TaxID=1424294 RepID=A0A1D8GD63_9FIRM|nr:hypothetical protein [Geosporobacter ferrireducens]AOT68847.1 hypothetical protein Gferi_04330 [Geosporobacter ferrireducens]MTI54920.1 hypothetical protein [Geosporobacter ferrireducens]